MAKGQVSTPYYIRTQGGDTYHVDTLDEAVADFIGEDGYRLTLTATDGSEVIIRRSAEPVDRDLLDNPEYNAIITFRSGKH